ncbi:MMPL family transporter [Dactylosporangium sp. NBC_01737]|uniref:MMPL family transporter n=1 Tax=Dactylosporangium sp. NBC_01737 TaxID=2975959 RepID=UPI002E101030|nr:MMPL family transporter [Dactylosporangium sp. NBC_01737]
MRRAVAVLGLWLVAGFLLLPLAGRIGDVTSTDQALVLPHSAETTRELLREREAFPGTDTPVAVVVYARDGGITDADRSTVDADRAVFEAAGHVVGPVTASRDGQALMLAFPVADKEAVKQIKSAVADAPPGLRAAVTGEAGALADLDEIGEGVDTTLFLAAAGIVAVLLLLTYRSPVLWIIPLLSAVAASQFTSAIVYLMGRHLDVTVTADLTTMMTVLVFGAGTDYALLLIARYREELHRHPDRTTAMSVAVRRSFPAILASAATVTIGVLCLLAAQMNDMRSFGPIAATGIIVSLAVMTTLLPALLVLLGRWVFWPFVPRFGTAIAVRRNGWHRVADLVGRRPRALWTVTAAVLVLLGLGVFGLRLGQNTSQMYTSEVGSVVGQQLVERHYSGGATSPAVIVAVASTVDGVVAAAKGVDGVADATSTARSVDGRWVRIAATLTDPPDSGAAMATIDRLRAAVHAVPGADAVVGGQTATLVDVGRASERDNAVVMPLILAVVFVVLVLLLRAVVAPLLLAASVAVSYVAAMGLSGLIFTAIGHPHIVQGMPLYAWLFLVTLGVDYTIFLMTRAREEVVTRGNRDGMLAALTTTGGVITSAGLVLAGTFGVLVVLPFVAAIQMGVIVAVGVLLDTFVVRTLLVPALAIDVGPRLWWPSRHAVRPAAPPPARVTADLAG